METVLEQAKQLKQTLLDFVFDAEGDLAVALERFSAEQLAHPSKFQFQGTGRSDLILDRFLVEVEVNGETPIAHFLDHNPQLTKSDRQLVESWQRSFSGLFMVTDGGGDRVEFVNWLTDKRYLVTFSPASSSEPLARLKPGDVVLTRLAPLTAETWMLSGPQMFLGKLGKPKLAVAIGHFRDDFPGQLYGDSPELLEAAWQSVERQYQEFIDYFGQEEVTLPGYQINQKLQELQTRITQKQLEAAGLTDNPDLDQLIQRLGLEKAEILENASALGADAKAVEELLADKSQTRPTMAAPPVQLPDPLKRAEHLTVLMHPRWGQVLLPTYTEFVAILNDQSTHASPEAEKLVRHYLTNPEIKTFVWRHLADHYPLPLEALLRATLKRPNFSLLEDLDFLLIEFNKPLEPTLPEIASVPLHLHNLFEEATLEVHKSKPKSKQKPKAIKGFG